MNVQDEIKELKQRIAELEKQAKEEQKFPQFGDTYYYIESNGRIGVFSWNEATFDLQAQEVGNIFHTEEEAEFAVEKLKVEEELRKFSRPFKEDENNYFIELYLFDKTLSIDSSEYFQTQGTIYFESAKVANEATDTVGEERIKKYIFGVEE